MRPKSLVGPLILIALGTLFLLRNVWPDIAFFEMFTRYWPFLLILWGTVRLVEVLVWYFGAKPLPAAGVSGGEWTLVVLLCIFGSMFHWGSHYYQTRWPAGKIAVRGLEIFGEPFEFPINADKGGIGKSPKIVLELGRGNARIVGIDTESVKVSGRKTIRAYSQSDADKGDKETPVEIVMMGDQTVIRTNQDRIDSSRRSTVDLEISVPKGASIEGRGKFGDFDINDIGGNVEINSDNAGVRVQNIGGNVKTDLGRSDVIRAVKVKGQVDLRTKSRGQDVEIESVDGPVTVNGSYSGQLNFRDLAKPLRFDSPETEMRVERTIGNVRIDLSNISGENLQGPIRLTCKSRDVQFREFTQSIEISLQRGDIELRPGKTLAGKIEARTKNGNVDFVAPLGSRFEMTATTSKGEITNDWGSPLKLESEGRGASLRGSTGVGPTVNLTSDRGAISVRKGGDMLPPPPPPPGAVKVPRVPATVEQ